MSLIPAGSEGAWQELHHAFDGHPKPPCTTEPDTWFPRHTQGDLDRQRGLCLNCPGTAACLTYAIQAREEFGIWGGTTPEERRAMRLRAERAAS